MRYPYRIMEYDGRFIIQAGTEITKGMLWWKKKEMEWIRTDINGVPLIYAPLIKIDTSIYPGRQPAFDTLKEARLKIMQWQKGSVIHESK